MFLYLEGYLAISANLTFQLLHFAAGVGGDGGFCVSIVAESIRTWLAGDKNPPLMLIIVTYPEQSVLVPVLYNNSSAIIMRSASDLINLIKDIILL